MRPERRPDLEEKLTRVAPVTPCFDACQSYPAGTLTTSTFPTLNDDGTCTVTHPIESPSSTVPAVIVTAVDSSAGIVVGLALMVQPGRTASTGDAAIAVTRTARPTDRRRRVGRHQASGITRPGWPGPRAASAIPSRGSGDPAPPRCRE
jgi:hypothetical protein